MPLSDVLVKEQVQATRSDEEFLQEPEEEKETGIVYPDSDGEPMGETGIHVRATMHLYGALLNFFCYAEDVYVAADMFFYYEKGNPRAVKAPDVMVIKGVATYERRTFKTWEEQALPCIIFEITSKSSMIDDLVTKSFLYARLGIREYFLFDPLHEYLENQVIGFRLNGDEYTRLEPDATGVLVSEELGLLVTVEGHILRLTNPKTGEPVPDYVETLAMAEQERQRAEQEAQRAGQETQRAEQATQRADQEKRRADEAEAELTRLRALLEKK